MDDKKKMVPRIRFRGFDDLWEQRKLGEIAKLSSSKRIHASDYVKNGIPFFRGSEISSGKFDDTKSLYISRHLYEKIKEEYGIPKNGDILVTAVGTLGNVWKVDDTEFYYKDGNLILINSVKIDSDFLYAFFSESVGKNRLLRSAAGSNQKALTMVKLREVEIDYPIREEQEHLSIFRQVLSQLIVANEKKGQQLKGLKKLLMEKIFSQAWRFKGFSDPWEQRKLSEIAKRVTRKNSELETSRPLTISADLGLVDQTNYFNKTVASANLREYILLLRGEFAYNKSYSKGYPFGTVKRLEKYESGAVSTLYIAFRSVKVNPLFLAQYYETSNWYREISKVAAEGARNHGLLNISPMDFMNTVLIVPSDDLEQEKIGKVLFKLDNLIVANEKKLDQLKQLKKYLMQNMFV